MGKQTQGLMMDFEGFKQSMAAGEPPPEFAAPLAALWWDAKGDWERAHNLVDELESRDGMAVHAYLHRKAGAVSNSEYWYERAGREFYRPELDQEWRALVAGLAALP